MAAEKRPRRCWPLILAIALIGCDSTVYQIELRDGRIVESKPLYSHLQSPHEFEVNLI